MKAAVSPPTAGVVESLLCVREVGARLAAGPWCELEGGRWGVPVVAYVSGRALPDVPLAAARGGWKVDRATKAASRSTDPNDPLGRGLQLEMQQARRGRTKRRAA